MHEHLQISHRLTATYGDFCARVTDLPGMLGRISRAFFHIHFYLSYVEHFEDIQNYPAHFTAGSILHITAGHLSLVKRISHIILASKALLLMKKAERSVRKAIDSFKNVLFSKYPVSPKTMQQIYKNETHKYLTTPYWTVELKASLPPSLFSIVYKIECLLQSLLELVRATFALSRALLSLFEALTYNRFTELKAITSSFIHTSFVVKELSKNMPLLIRELEGNKDGINVFLSMIGSSYKAPDLFSLLEKTGKMMKKVGSAMDKYGSSLHRNAHRTLSLIRPA